MKLASLSRGSKKWWKLNRELLQKKASISSIPPLKYASGQWILESKAKADLFAQTWGAKYQLPAEIEDRFFAAPTQRLRITSIIRTRTTMSELQKIDVNKATGPDLISGHILQKLWEEIALPLTIICRRILNEAQWPDCCDTSIQKRIGF